MKSKKFVLAGLALLAITGLLALTSCKNDSVSETHTHTFDENKWESDATGHWHPATCGHTGEKDGFASHTFGDWEVEEASATVKKVVEVCTCGYTQEVAGFVYIPAGTFQMGSTAGDPDEKPAHDVTISKGYFMGKCEVTQKEWAEVMKDNANGISESPSNFKNSPAENEDQTQRPVESVSWYDAVVYCNRRSIAEDLTPCYAIDGETDPSKWGGDGTVPTSSDEPWEVTCNWEANGYRLPTEAEWEYAARARDDTIDKITWSGTDTETKLKEYAWYTENSGNEAGKEKKTHQVGTLAPNAWGLHDMSGNVWEWCWDWYGNYSAESDTNPTGPADGSSGDGRVNRGGGWRYSAYACTVSNRSYNGPNHRSLNLGFRLVRSAN